MLNLPVVVVDPNVPPGMVFFTSNKTNGENILVVDMGEESHFYDLDKLEWLVPITPKDDMGSIQRHVTAKFSACEAMVEFYHVDNGDYAGCVGINTFREYIRDGKVGLVEYE